MVAVDPKRAWRRGGGGGVVGKGLRGRTALAVWLMVVSASLARAADEFPVPSQLAGAVQFWIDVFTRYSLDDVVVHDRLEPGLVYQVVRGANGGRDTAGIERGVQAVADHLVLKRALPPSPWSFLLVPDAARGAADPVGHARLRVQRGLREVFAEALVAQRLYRPVVEQALAREGLPSALAALPLIESSYRPEAESPAGAVGLWQLTRETGCRYLRIGGGIDERRDPARSSEAAARHLALLRAALPSWPLALTAYNRGLAGVERARRAAGSDDLGTVIARYREHGFGFAARNFYAEFVAALHVERNVARYFPELAPVRVVEYRVKPGDTLTAVARRHGVSLAALRVNNGLRSAALQPGQRILIRL